MDIIEELREICSAYSDILGVVILFGSYSRGEQTKDNKPQKALHNGADIG